MDTDVDLTLKTDVAGDFTGQTLALSYTSNEIGGSGLGNTDVGG